MLETDDGATIMVAWSGLARTGPDGTRELVGSVTHTTDGERYRWLNDRVGAVSGEVRARVVGGGFDVVIDVAELVWEPAT